MARSKKSDNEDKQEDAVFVGVSPEYAQTGPSRHPGVGDDAVSNAAKAEEEQQEKALKQAQLPLASHGDDDSSEDDAKTSSNDDKDDEKGGASAIQGSGT